jgi:hypothetical protein
MVEQSAHISCVISDAERRTSEDLSGNSEVSSVIVHLDLAIADFDTRQVGEQATAQPNLEADTPR